MHQPAKVEPNQFKIGTVISADAHMHPPLHKLTFLIYLLEYLAIYI